MKPSLQRGRPPGAPFDYSIRPLQRTDLEGISRVHWRACSIAYEFMNWSYTEDEVRRWYAGKLGEWDWGRVVCAGETIVAFLAAIGAHIDQLFVDPDHQRVGVGSALLGVMLERGLRPATLQVFAQNTPAHVFYERFGFRQGDAWWDAQDQAINLLYKLEQSFPRLTGPAGLTRARRPPARSRPRRRTYSTDQLW